MNISDILRHKTSSAAAAGAEVVTIDAAGSVTALLDALARYNVGALVVTDATAPSGAVVGIVSERDVVRRLAERGAAVLDGRVEQLMTSTVLSCTSHDSVDSVAETMTEHRVRHMPVIDDGELSGIVSIGDVVSSRIRQLEQDRGQLEQYISG